MAYSRNGGMDLRGTSDVGQIGFDDCLEVRDEEERRNIVDFKTSRVADKRTVMPIGNIKESTGLGFSRYF